MATFTRSTGSRASRFIQLRYEMDVTGPGLPSAIDILQIQRRAVRKPSFERKSTPSRLLAFCFTPPIPSVQLGRNFVSHIPCTYPYHVQFIRQMSSGRYNGTLSHCSAGDAIMWRRLAKRDESKRFSSECLIVFDRSMFQTPPPIFFPFPFYTLSSINWTPGNGYSNRQPEVRG